MNKTRFALVAVPFLTGVSGAFAAVPAAVTTAISEAQADGIVVASLVLVAVIALWAIKFMRRGL